jgi:Macroglobulin domain MG3
VAVATPNFITNMNEKFTVGTDCAYTFGKPVESTVTIKATPMLTTQDEVPEIAEPVTITRDCTGACSTEINPADFKVPTDRTLDSVLIETAVEEKATGSIVEANDKTIVFSNKKVSNKYDVILEYFNSVISGTQHLIQVHVRRNDNQSLPADQSVTCQYLFDANVQDSTTTKIHQLDVNGKTDILINILFTVNNFMNFRVRIVN